MRPHIKQRKGIATDLFRQARIDHQFGNPAHQKVKAADLGGVGRKVTQPLDGTDVSVFQRAG